MVIDLGLQMGDEFGNLLAEPVHPLAAHDLGIDDGRHSRHRVAEIVVHHDVIVLLDRL